MIEWKNQSKDIEDYQGFIYRIIRKSDGKFYIGRKYYWKTIKMKPLKGRKNKRHKRIESDWKSYLGSSNSLTEDIELLGENAFEKEILMNCYTKWECSYYEMKYQVNEEVLFRDDCYNGLIRVRLKKQKVK